METVFNDYFSSVFTVEDTTIIPKPHSTTSLPVVDLIDFTPDSEIVR